MRKMRESWTKGRSSRSSGLRKSTSLSAPNETQGERKEPFNKGCVESPFNQKTPSSSKANKLKVHWKKIFLMFYLLAFEKRLGGLGGEASDYSQGNQEAVFPFNIFSETTVLICNLSQTALLNPTISRMSPQLSHRHHWAIPNINSLSSVHPLWPPFSSVHPLWPPYSSIHPVWPRFSSVHPLSHPCRWMGLSSGSLKPVFQELPRSSSLFPMP